MLGISRLQQTALTKAKVYDRLVTMQGTKATISATVAQKAFNLIANANPYVLLATALVTVVGALTLFSMGTKDAAEKQKRLNEYQKAYSDYLEKESEEMNRTIYERITRLEQELSIAKARNAGLIEIRKIEDEILLLRTKAHNKSVGYYSDELRNLELNRYKLEQFRDLLINLQNLQKDDIKTTYIDVDLDGKIEKVKVDKAIENVQGQIDKLGHDVELGVNLETKGMELDTLIKAQYEQRKQEDKNIAKQETDILRKAEDIRISLIKNSFDQQRSQRKAANARSIADIKYQLETDNNLTEKARKSLNDSIISLRKQLDNELKEIDKQQNASELATIRLTEDAKIALLEEGADKQRELLRVSYERQIQDLTNSLNIERDSLTEIQKNEMESRLGYLRDQYTKDLNQLEDQITSDMLQKESDRIQLELEAVEEGSEKEIDLRIKLLQNQRKIELAQNRLLSKEMRQSEADINAKYDAQIVKELKAFGMDKIALNNELAVSEINALKISEKEKTKLILEETKKRLKAELALETKPDGTLTERGKIIANQIKEIDNEIDKTSKPSNIYELFGLNLTSEQEQAISTAAQYAIDAINSIADAKVQAAERAVEAADREVEAAQNALDAEREARANGYASNVEQAQKELDLAKKNQEKALKEQAKAQKQQEAINSLEQASNLVTASAGIFKSFSGVGIWGIPAAIAMIATMWGAFAAAKIKASQLTKGSEEKYGDGTVELLQGGSHQSGNDVDLGTKPDGTRRRAEGGEFFAVINKRNSRRFRKVIPDVIKSLNNGTFTDKYLAAYDGVNNISVNLKEKNTDLNDIRNDIREIKNRERTYRDANGDTITAYKNLKRRIKS